MPKTKFFEENKQCAKCSKFSLKTEWIVKDEDAKNGITSETCPKCNRKRIKIHDYGRFENGKLVEYRSGGKVYILSNGRFTRGTGQGYPSIGT